MAALLASVGLYGVTSYTVAERTREFGIHTALGARTGRVLGLVVGRALRLSIAGIGLGPAASAALSRVIESRLFGVKLLEPLTIAGATAAVLVLSLVAALVPAWCATAVDPAVALRAE